MTGLSKDIQKRLARLEKQGSLREVKVNPWGFVFGLRKDDGTWVFELVKCVSLSYWKVAATSWKKVGENRPNIFGLGGGQLGINPADGSVTYVTSTIGQANKVYTAIQQGDYSTQKFSDCKAIGYKQFFPGRGKTELNDIDGTLTY